MLLAESEQVEAPYDPKLALLLAMAMFVLVVDTSLMNVSISAVVEDIGTTVSGVQSAIALEALVSAAFILIGSKVGDLFGRKRAYVLGLLGYMTGAIAMTLAQDLRTIIIFWAIIGGLGASLLLPAMQSLIHGNFEGAAQRKVYALVGASAAIAAAVGPLLGGFITTYFSWRVAFALEARRDPGRALGASAGARRAVHRLSRDRPGRRRAFRARHGRHRARHPGLAGGCRVGRRPLALGAAAMAAFCFWLVRRKRAGKADADRSRALQVAPVPLRASPDSCCSRSRWAGLMIALPIYLQMVLEYNAMEAGLSLAPLSLSMFAVAVIAGKKAGARGRAASSAAGFASRPPVWCCCCRSCPGRIPGWWLLVPLIIAGAGLGLLVSQLNNYTLSPISEERVSEAAGVNSAGGSFGLSFGLAFAGAIMLATLSFSFTNMANDSKVLPPDDKEQVAAVLEDDAEIMTNTQLEQLLADEPPEIQAEIIRINTDARHIALQVALIVPLVAALLGLGVSFRMMRQPDPEPSGAGRDGARRLRRARWAGCV